MGDKKKEVWGSIGNDTRTDTNQINTHITPSNVKISFNVTFGNKKVYRGIYHQLGEWEDGEDGEDGELR